jgi:hypothetical protein
MIKYLTQNLGLLVVATVLLGGVSVLQLEVGGLQSRLDKRDSAAAVAISKFERDYFARLDAEQVAKANMMNRAQAQLNSVTRAELQNLPSGSFHTTVAFPTP